MKGLVLTVSRMEPPHVHVPDPKKPAKKFEAVLVNLKSNIGNGIIVFPHFPTSDIGKLRVGDQFTLKPVKTDQEEKP